MPKNHTENYHLNQWEPEDAVRRVDFNEDNRKLDEALTGLAGTLSQHAGSMAKLGNCQLYTTSYSGNGSTGSSGKRSLNFPSKPYLVLIGGTDSFMLLFYGVREALTVYRNVTSINIPSWSGTSVSWYSIDDQALFMMNASGETYQVVALLKAGE